MVNLTNQDQYVHQRTVLGHVEEACLAEMDNPLVGPKDGEPADGTVLVATRGQEEEQAEPDGLDFGSRIRDSLEPTEKKRLVELKGVWGLFRDVKRRPRVMHGGGTQD